MYKRQIIGGDVTIENPGSSTTTATLHGSNSTITANFKQSIRSITINLDRFYSSTSSTNSGKSYEYLTVSSTDCSGIICRIYGQTKNDMDNMDEVSYPVRIEQNQKVMYAYSDCLLYTSLFLSGMVNLFMATVNVRLSCAGISSG